MKTFRVGNMEVLDLRESLPTSGQYERRNLADIRYLAVHHSGVDVDSSAESIARYHIDTQGWPGIGYHFLVHWDGTLEYVGDVHEMRYNVASRNREVIGICLPGDFTNRLPSWKQLEATRRLLAEIQFSLGRFVPIVGHREVALPGFATECPGKSWGLWKPLVIAQGV